MKYVQVGGDKVEHIVIDEFDTRDEAETVVRLLRENRWGFNQTFSKIGSGVYWVDTQTHGGIVVSKTRAAQIKEKFPDFHSSFSSNYEYEEDCDWAVVAMAFPDLFDDYGFYCAYRTLACREGSEWIKHIDDSLRDRFAEIMKKYADHYVRSSYASNGTMSTATYRRVGDGTLVTSNYGDGYYASDFMTEAQIYGRDKGHQ
jgi:hypothetical protein